MLVGLGKGLLLGVSYAVAGVPSPVLRGAATAAMAIIPFGAPVAFLAGVGFLASTGNMSGAIGVVVWGSVVRLIADHPVRPRIIGGTTWMPFLVVLFGISGGIETFGFIGLFIGPSVMSLFVTLWRKSAEETVGSPPGSGHVRSASTAGRVPCAPH